MAVRPTFFAELKRRNVLRAAVLYAGAVWALSQGISQLSPAFDLQTDVTRWFVIACTIGFPFWVAFAWFYEFTPQGLKRESEIEADASITRSTGRKLDRAIIGVLALAVVLLLTNTFVWRKGAGLSAGAAAIPQKSVAVLPLANESGDQGQLYFSDGLSDGMITALSQFPELKVISRNSSFRFRNSKQTSAQIGRELGVANLLEGSVQRSGSQVRIRLELVNAVDGRNVWSQTYDRPYLDLFKLQDDITSAVAVALQAPLLGGAGDRAKMQSNRPPGGSVAAYDALLDGNYNYAQESEKSLRKAIDSFQRATVEDPAYAMAYARLSMVWTELAGTMLGPSSPERLKAVTKAQEAADTALRLDPDLAETHVARGFLLAWSLLDWRGAQVEFNKALALDPSNRDAKKRLADTLATLGRVGEAIQLDKQGLETNPMDGGTYGSLAYFYSGLWQLDDAEHAIRRAIALQPDGIANQANLAVILVQRGDAKGALQAAKAETTPNNRAWALALAYAASADRASADSALKDFIAKFADSDPYNIAEVFSYRRQPDQAFAWLDRARGLHDGSIQYLLFDPFLLRYKDDPRFAAFCGKVGLPLPAASAKR